MTIGTPLRWSSFTRSRLTSMMSTSPRRSIARRVDSSGTIRNVRTLYFGVPARQWNGTASSLMCEPVTCSTKRYGPLPTGLRAKTSSPLASRYLSDAHHPLGGQAARQVLGDDERRLLGDDHDAVG